MGRSITRPRGELQERQEGSHGSARWVSLWNGKQLIHAVNDQAVAVDWAVGSGHQGKSYLVQFGDALFQSPLAWYASRRAWDLSPGYPAERRLNFLRPITEECLTCHAGSAATIPGTLNRYAPENPIPEPAIGCERCHGDPGAHLKEARRGNIVNPARLAHSARDSTCEQCHLSGSARIPNPGRKFSDFRPGMKLEEVFSVYIPAQSQDGNQVKVVSHSEQLALSRCAMESGGKLWCATCHDPHTVPADSQQWHRQQCNSCHADTKPHGEDCAGCHMPRIKAYDGGHTAFTDHRIRRAPGQKKLLVRSEELRAWREPAAPLRQRSLGLAYVNTGKLQQAYDLLRNAPRDGAVNGALGMIYLQAGEAQAALPEFEAAVKEEPQNSTRRLNLAVALFSAKQIDRARQEALEAMRLEPMLQDAYVLMAELEPRRAAHWREEFEKRLKK